MAHKGYAGLKMDSKLLALLTATLLIGSSAPVAMAVTGSFLPVKQASLTGPLINHVYLAPSCNGDEGCFTSAISGGGAQAVEWAFSVSAYDSILLSCSTCLGQQVVEPGWSALTFNFAKFPGDDYHFRRAMAFAQDYSYMQTTVLGGSQGTASPDAYVCPPYSTGGDTPCPSPDPMSVYSPQSLATAGQELEEIDGSYVEPDGNTVHLYCDNSGVPCAGSYSSSSEWCVGALGSGSNCGIGTTFAPFIEGRTTLHRNLWADKMRADLLTIGVHVAGTDQSGSGAAATCFTPNAIEVVSPGVYNSGTGYNSNPTFDSGNVAADLCDMYTDGFISTSPSLLNIAQTVDGQFAGSTVNTGNAYDDPSWTYPSDPACPSCATGPHTTTMNVDWDANQIINALSISQAVTAALNMENALAMTVSILPGFYLTTPWIANLNGWTGVVNEAEVGGGELGGIYWTLQNAHQCGTSTCTLGATNGGTLGGTFQYNVEYGADGAFGFNPAYNGNWVWQAVILDEFYDSQMVTGPAQFNQTNAFTNYMTTSSSASPFTGVLGHGGSWFYFQQSCTHGSVMLTSGGGNGLGCQGKAGYAQHPGPLQHGQGLTTSAKTITSGEVITYNFKPGITFYDGQPVTAKDLIATLDALDVAASPNYPDSGSPAYGVSGGSTGLIAAHIIPGTHNLGVELYYGLFSIWNQGNSISLIMPAHVLKYINLDNFATSLCAMNLAAPWATASTSCSGITTGTFHMPGHSFIQYVNNMNVGSGPFVLSCLGYSHDSTDCYDSVNSQAMLDRNPYYFNSNWQAEALFNSTSQGNTFTFTTPHIIQIYNPTTHTITCGPSTPTPIAPGTWGNCQLMAPWAQSSVGTAKVYDSNGNLVLSLQLTHDTNTGLYSVNIPTATLNFGAYQLVIQAKYHLKPPGAPSASSGNVWYESTGFTVTP
jgi:hypothetical protein